MGQTRSRSSGKYRETEVRALIEEYGATLNERDTDTRGLRALVQVADLKLAWRHLSSDERKILLIMGVMGLPSREAGELLQKSHVWAQKRYRKTLEDLTWLMNGGDE